MRVLLTIGDETLSYQADEYLPRQGETVTIARPDNRIERYSVLEVSWHLKQMEMERDRYGAKAKRSEPTAIINLEAL